jgi:hypothetical protein
LLEAGLAALGQIRQSTGIAATRLSPSSLTRRTKSREFDNIQLVHDNFNATTRLHRALEDAIYIVIFGTSAQ